ncbi:DUF4097 domain-containing protein [Shewanella waksmanii]|uniref:DUF4097 family beta strand repeat-containing protein n=1 Tax=Shewanella waksmanii TaxID=213783 RepID=UPI00373524A0
MNIGRKLSALILPIVLVAQSVYASEKIDKTIEVTADLKLSITVQRGEVSVSSWDKPMISIKGTLDELSEGFSIEQDGNTVRLEDKMPKRYKGSNKKGSKLTFMVPKNLTVDMDGVSSDFDIQALQGKIHLDTVSGDIQAKTLSDNIYLQTVSGDIISQSLSGDVRLDTVSGSITDSNSKGSINFTLVSGDLSSESQAKTVQADLVSGNAKLKLQQVDALELKSVSGDLNITLTQLTDKASLDSVSGDITMNLPRDINAHFKIDGGPSGDISNGLSDHKPMKAKYTRSESLQFQLGNGQADVRISTISGDIDLK